MALDALASNFPLQPRRLMPTTTCDGRTFTSLRASASNALNPLGFFICHSLNGYVHQSLVLSAKHAAFNLWLLHVVAFIGREFIEPEVLAAASERTAYLPLNLRTRREYLREVSADFVPITLAAFTAAPAVVVSVAEPVHGRKLNAAGTENVIAIFLGDSASGQHPQELHVGAESFNVRNAASLISGEAENVNVIGSLILVPQFALHRASAGRPERRDDKSLATPRLFNRTIFGMSQLNDGLADPSLNILKESPVVRMLILGQIEVDDFNQTLFGVRFASDFGRNRAGCAAREVYEDSSSRFHLLQPHESAAVDFAQLAVR
ncbi:MAG: hypothetical protein WAN65_12600 [Candidatus Sulfotelmatobacter sp.]